MRLEDRAEDYKPGGIRSGWQHEAIPSRAAIPGRVVRAHGSAEESFGQVARGSRSGVAVHDVPHQFSHNVHSTALPCSPLAASWVASFRDCAFLPVWPSTRFLFVATTEQFARGRGS